MKRLTLFLIMLLTSAALAQGPKTPIKNVAVVETQIDERSGVASEINRAEVGVITDEIRREAVNNLPRARYSVMTSETVQSMGSAVLAECAEENCVIALGSKIGADYIVRGVISKFQNMFTLSVEMYETEYGMLVATAAPVRTVNLSDLLEKSTAACAAMYRKFLEASLPAGAQQAVAPAPSRETTRLETDREEAIREQVRREAQEQKIKEQAKREMVKQEREQAKRERTQAKLGVTEKRLARKHMLGVRQIFSGDYYGIEPYLRSQRNENKRTYLGLGFTTKDEWRKPSGSEYQAAGFMEWHLKDNGSFASFNIYGGPGAVLGYYSYDWAGIGVSGPGLDIGGQGGARLRLGAFVIGAEARALCYMRFWDSGIEGGITLPVGMTLGITF